MVSVKEVREQGQVDGKLQPQHNQELTQTLQAQLHQPA